MTDVTLSPPTPAKPSAFPFAAVESVQCCPVRLTDLALRQMREGIGKEASWAERASLTRQGWGLLDGTEVAR